MLEPPVKPIEWRGDRVSIIDQRELPETECHLDLKDAEEVADAISTMALRGAPLIGVAAAMGVALEARRWVSSTWDDFKAKVEKSIRVLGATRPTAANLFWALDRMERVLTKTSAEKVTKTTSKALVVEALRIYEEDIETGVRLGEIGVKLIKNGFTILTHCNAGGLATSGFGTALAPIYLASRLGMRIKVIADETRPLLQGARLTAWELARAGVDVTVVCDGASHFLISRGGIDLVLVGADRITVSGDFANKIGTYGIAVSSERGGVPFYVVAPSSTIDFNLDKGEDVPIEERDASEVTHISGVRVVPSGVSVLNPAFDITPAELVSGFITEKGLVSPPYRQNLSSLRPESTQMR
jgi:methylthioribose-1-phosphate isomerase